MVKQLYISIDRVLWDKPKVCLYIKFRIGIYNFSKEHFMLSFIKISALYESYLLAKFLCYFRDRGSSLESSCHLGGQTFMNQTGYGSEYEGDMLVHEGTLYGEVTDFQIIGVIVEER